MSNNKILINMKNSLEKGCFCGIIEEIRLVANPTEHGKFMKEYIIKKKIDLPMPDKDVEEWWFGIQGLVPKKVNKEYEKYVDDLKQPVVIQAKPEEEIIFPEGILSLRCTIYFITSTDNSSIDKIPELGYLHRMKQEIEHYKESIRTLKNMLERQTQQISMLANEEMTDSMKETILSGLQDMRRQLSTANDNLLLQQAPDYTDNQ